MLDDEHVDARIPKAQTDKRRPKVIGLGGFVTR